MTADCYKMVTFLLGYIDHCIASKNILLVASHYASTAINALTYSLRNNTETIGVKL